jgi:putative ABC transport system permease protein
VARLALANLIRPGAPSTSIMVALGLGLTLLATVALLDASVRAEVEDQLPERAPSFFFADIQKEQVEPFKAEIERFNSASDFTATPMLRGRIVKLNGVPAEEAKIAADAQWAINCDRGVTYASVPPENTRVVEGPEWWPADYRGAPLLSFDAGLARGMGLKIGDTITLNILGRDMEATIFNLRRIDFRTGGVNFINIMSPGTIDQAPHSFLATVRAAAGDEEAMFSAVSRAFPNITIVRVKEALAQAGELLAMLAQGISIASLVTILAGVLVLAGAIAAGHRARLYDAVVLKVLGATRARLGAVYVIEYGLLGLLAGLAALGASTVAAWAVAYFVLDIPFVFAPRAVAFTIVGGALGTLVLGLAGGFAALSAKPASRLRNP